MFRAILSAHNLPNASELILRCFAVQRHMQKQRKEFFKAKKWNVVQWPSQSPDLNPIEPAFHLLKTILNKNKQEVKTGLAEHHQG